MPNTCPHCRRPVRIGAKYCGFCGTSLITSPPPAEVPSGPKLQPPLLPLVDIPAATRERRAKRKRSRLIISLVAVLLICLVIGIPLALIGQPLIDEIFSSETLTCTPTQTSLPVPTNTPTLRPSPTQTPSPTPTRLPTATPTRSPSITPTRLLPPTNTSTLSPLLLEDDFSQQLDRQWESWGTLETTLISDPAQALLLRAADVNSGGISSLDDQITLAPGTVITFIADVAYLDDDIAELRFAWSPEPATPPELADPLPLELLIQSRLLTVQFNPQDGTPLTCTSALEDTRHTFRLEMSRDGLPRIFVDDTLTCEYDLRPMPRSSLTGGRIHFSGSGLIEFVSVKVTP